MDTIITINEVTMLLASLPSLVNVCPNFENIQVLCRHFEQALQHLPCPQSTLHGWKGMVMARELYALLTPNPFRLPNNPGPNAVYVRPIDPNNPGVVPDPAVPLTRTEQATINLTFTHLKNYYMSMINIEQACFMAVNAYINDAFKVSNDPTIQRWHAGMMVMSILDQLLDLYGKPTPAALEGNDTRFRSPYLVADPPKLIFHWIEECAKISLLGRNPYTNRQLINNAIRLLLTTGLYLWPFEEWDRLQPLAQTWIALQAIIQESFQRRLNATAPTAGHQGYVSALPHQQNAFGALANDTDTDDDSVETLATQVSTLTYQSQLTALMAANSSHRHEPQLAHLALQQNLMHENMHQLIAGLNAVAFNVSNEGQVSDDSAHAETTEVDMVANCADVVALAPVGADFCLQECTVVSLPLADMPGDVSRDLSPKDLQPHPLAYHAAHSLTLSLDCPGHHHSVLSLPPSLHNKCNSTNNHSQTRLNATPAGTCATCVVSTWPTVTQACHAQPILERPHMTSTSCGKTPNNTLIWDTPVAPKINIGRNSPACDG
jgi:hypothetical protein